MKKHVGRARSGWDSNNKMVLPNVGWHSVDSIAVAEVGFQCQLV